MTGTHGSCLCLEQNSTVATHVCLPRPLNAETLKLFVICNVSLEVNMSGSKGGVSVASSSERYYY